MFSVRFWGVRGNVPTPGPDTVRYGGNTACVEVRVADQHLIFDGGTGLRVLGHALAQRRVPVQVHLFFTHAHWDRIQGFPFFRPAFDPASHLHIYGTTALNGASIKQCLMDQMLQPNFFKPLQAMQAEMVFHNIQAGSRLALGEVGVETLSLNRHTGGLGFRVSWGHHAVVYASDTDPSSPGVNPNLVYLAQGADVMILDGTFIETAYADSAQCHRVPWQLAVKTAQASGAKQLVLFHHNPCHSDEDLDRVERQVQAAFPQARLAQEGMEIDLLAEV